MVLITSFPFRLLRQEGIPFGKQAALELGAGVKLDKPEAASIRKAIDKVLSNSTYREKAAEISKGFRRCAGAKGAAEKILSVIRK